MSKMLNSTPQVEVVSMVDTKTGAIEQEDLEVQVMVMWISQEYSVSCHSTVLMDGR